MRNDIVRIAQSKNYKNRSLLSIFHKFFLPCEFIHRYIRLAAIVVGANLFFASTLVSAQQVAAATENKEPLANAKSPEEIIESQPASAGSVPEEVTIKAARQKTLKAVHDEPKSVSIITGVELDRELASDYNAITKRLANVAFNQANTRSATLSIRGIGKRGSAEVQDPSVSVSQDGVSFGLISLGNFEFYDVDTVEALRGPTGTLGGKGGSAGQVSITTKKPSFTQSSDFSIGYGQWDNLVVRAATGGPLIDGLLAWRGSVLVSKGQGFYRNEYGFDDNRTFYNKDRAAGRIQLLVTPTDELNINLSYDKQPKGNQLENGLTFYHDQPEKYDNGALTDPGGTSARAKLYGFTNSSGTWVGARDWFAGRPSPETPGRTYSYYDDYVVNEAKGTGRVAFDEFQGQYNSTGGSSADVEWNNGDYLVKSLTAYRFFYFNAHNDEGTPFDISKHGGGGIQFTQYSQEFSVSSKIGDLFDYKTGIFLYKSNTEIDSRTGWGADAGAWFATNAQYNLLERNAGINHASGLTLLKDSLNDLFKDGNTWVDTKSNAIFGQGDLHWSDAATLTIGLRVGGENRSTTDDVPLANNGSGGALNPDQIRGIQLGGFASVTNGNLGANVKNPDGTTTVVDNNTPAQLSLADKVARDYFGATITAVPGAAYKSLTSAQKAQVGAAKGIRATQIGQIYRNVKSDYDDTLYTSNLSQSYKFSEDLTGYVTWQHGEKSGTAFNVNGVPVGVKPETTNAFEIGAKTFWLNNTLTLNADIYVAKIKNYQQSVQTVDDFATNLALSNLAPNASDLEKNAAVVYVTSQGNVPEVRAQGIEFDGTYTGVENFTFRISGAYNDAHYVEFKNVPKPQELGYLEAPYIDRSGETVPGASKWTVNAGIEYRLPLEKSDIRTSINSAYLSSYNIGDTYSTYGVLPSYVITDFSIGLAGKSDEFDASIIVKNIFDEAPHEAGWVSYQPFLQRRWVGFVLTNHF